MGGDHGASAQERPRTVMLGNSHTDGVALIPAVLVGLSYLLINGLVAVIAFLATWLIAAFLVRCGFAIINMERLLHDRL